MNSPTIGNVAAVIAVKLMDEGVEYLFFLLQKKSPKYPPAPGQWTLFGGNVKDHESPDQAIERELKKELQVKSGYQVSLEVVTKPVAKDVDQFIKDGQTVHRQVYRCELKVNNLTIKASPLSNIQLGEGAGMVLFAHDELPAYEQFIVQGDYRQILSAK